MITIKSSAGSHISDSCKEALATARWAIAHLASLPSLDGHWIALAEQRLLHSWNPADTSEIPEDARDPSDRWFTFWEIVRTKVGDAGRGAVLGKVSGTDPDVRFVFNDIEVILRGPLPEDDDQIVGAMLQQWEDKRQAAHDAYWTPERRAAEERRKQAEAERLKKRKAAVATALGEHPFEPLDADAYAQAKAKNEDPYGAACYSYAESWAALMDREIARGATLADIADDTSHEADVEGITGFMYGCAVSILAQFWKRGDELRRWHNLKTQIGNEGEKANEQGAVLNPALLRLG